MKSNITIEPIVNFQDRPTLEPDLPKRGIKAPAKNHVLCRTASQSTAVYGNNTWDFNPYNTSNESVPPLYFDKIFNSKGEYEDQLIAEVKFILFSLYYHTNSGIAGRPSVNTLMHYWQTTRKVARYCYELSNYSAIGKISLQEFVGNPRYVAMFIKKYLDIADTAKTFPTLMRHLQNLSPVLHWNIVNPEQYAMTRIDCDQHPVIPPRIYLQLYTYLLTQTSHIRKHASNMAEFIKNCRDPAFARNDSGQYKLGIPKKQHRPYLDEAIRQHNLTDLFTGDFALSESPTIKEIQRRVILMQYVLYNMILFTTGMRDQELLRATCDCININIIPTMESSSPFDKIIPKENITLISSTTKQEGYEAVVSWIATEETQVAVEAASILAKAIATLYEVDGLPYLFLSATKITLHDNAPKVQTMKKKMYLSLKGLKTITIEENDFELLTHSDISRDFESDDRFQVGKPWPLTSHQHRRSLGYYAYNSRLVSETVLMQQFQHRNLLLTRYYGKGFEQLTTIFGFYDPEKKTHVVPQSHIALEFQTGMPTAVADEIIRVLLLDGKLSGGTGEFLENQKTGIASGEITILEFRDETILKAKQGFGSYRSTLLGGCTKEGRCDALMLGDFMSCTECDSSIILEEPKQEVLNEFKNDLKGYKPNEAEYQIIMNDIKKLEKA